MLLPSSKVVVLFTVAVPGFPPAGENDGVGVFVSYVAKRKKSPGAIFRERSEPEGRVSGMIRANPVKICVRRSCTQHAAKPRYSFHSSRTFTTYSILPAYRACRDARRRVETGVSPTPKGGVGGIPPTFARTRATDSSHTSHRLLGGVSRRRCPSHTTVFCGVAAINSAAPAAIICWITNAKGCISSRYRSKRWTIRINLDDKP